MMNKTNQANRAYDIAVAAHAGQARWDGSPYIEHPIRVAGSVGGGKAKAVAFLHDVLEDTSVTVSDLAAAEIDEAVIEAVKAITRRDDETYAAFIDRVAHNELARVVKLADLADNLKDLPEERVSLRRRYERAVAILTT
jgi:(p)ppGpp synthase/HD superfamily hydrolase